MTGPVRILLLEVPKLLRDILEQTIGHDHDYELIFDSRSAVEILSEHVALPDVVILGLTATEDAILLPGLFARWPSTQVMTIQQPKGDAVVYDFGPRRQALGERSPTEILEILRDSVRRKRQLAG